MINRTFFNTAVAVTLALGITAPAAAQVAPAPAQADQNWALHAQATFVTQGVAGFSSPYEGPNSLAPSQVKETFDATVYAGVRP